MKKKNVKIPSTKRGLIGILHTLTQFLRQVNELNLIFEHHNDHSKNYTFISKCEHFFFVQFFFPSVGEIYNNISYVY